MKELQTKLGTDIPVTTRGIVYLCKLYDDKLDVINEILCDSSFDALNYYSNIRNPESQLITGKDYDELITNMHNLHNRMSDKKWINVLKESI